MEYFLTFSIALNLLLLYGVRNLIKKDEKKEIIIEQYDLYINRLSTIIEDCDKKLKEVDAKGSFESDDEIGFFFKTLKELQDILNTFTIK